MSEERYTPSQDDGFVENLETAALAAPGGRGFRGAIWFDRDQINDSRSPYYFMAQDIPDEAVALLTSEPLIAHLATCRDGKPHVSPLWYNYRDGAVEIVTTGRKLANIRENPRVALSVQKDEGGHPQWGVSIRGTAEVIEDGGEGREMLHRINRRYGAEDDAWSENTPVRIDVGSVDYWEY